MMKTSFVLYCLVGMVCMSSEMVKARKEENLKINEKEVGQK